MTFNFSISLLSMKLAFTFFSLLISSASFSRPTLDKNWELDNLVFSYDGFNLNILTKDSESQLPKNINDIKEKVLEEINKGLKLCKTETGYEDWRFYIYEDSISVVSTSSNVEPGTSIYNSRICKNSTIPKEAIIGESYLKDTVVEGKISLSAVKFLGRSHKIKSTGTEYVSLGSLTAEKDSEIILNVNKLASISGSTFHGKFEVDCDYIRFVAGNREFLGDIKLQANDITIGNFVFKANTSLIGTDLININNAEFEGDVNLTANQISLVDNVVLKGNSSLTATNKVHIGRTVITSLQGECADQISISYTNANELNISDCIKTNITSLNSGEVMNIQGSGEFSGSIPKGGTIKNGIMSQSYFSPIWVTGAVNIDVINGLRINYSQNLPDMTYQGDFNVSSICSQMVELTLFVNPPSPLNANLGNFPGMVCWMGYHGPDIISCDPVGQPCSK